MLARDLDLSRAVMDVAKTFNVPFMGLAGTCHQQAAEEADVPFIAGQSTSLSTVAEINHRLL